MSMRDMHHHSLTVRVINTILLLYAGQLALYCWLLGLSAFGLYFSALAVGLMANGIRMR